MSTVSCGSQAEAKFICSSASGKSGCRRGTSTRRVTLKIEAKNYGGPIGETHHKFKHPCRREGVRASEVRIGPTCSADADVPLVSFACASRPAHSSGACLRTALARSAHCRHRSYSADHLSARDCVPRDREYERSAERTNQAEVKQIVVNHESRASNRTTDRPTDLQML